MGAGGTMPMNRRCEMVRLRELAWRAGDQPCRRRRRNPSISSITPAMIA
jgi:hypothetical protein